MHENKTKEELLDEIQELRKQIDYLRPFEDRYKVLSEHIWDYAYSFRVNEDGSRQHEWTTGSFKKITGYEPGSKFNIYHPDDVAKSREDVKQVMEGKAVQNEYRIITPDNEMRWLLIQRVPLKDEAGNIVRYLGVAQDITQRKEAENLLDSKGLELTLSQARQDWLQEFFSMLSHDLKTPLSIIKNSLYLSSKTSDPEKKAERLKQIKMQVDRLQQLIDDILDTSRLDSEPKLDYESLDLSEMLTKVAGGFEDRIIVHQLHLHLDLDDNLPEVSGDRLYLERSLYNLIENAIQYTTEGGTITLRSRLASPDVLIEVMDTGIGIDETELSRIFEHFYRVDQSRSMRTGGSGLGLAIVKKVIEKHGGKVEVNSTPGEGSCFRLYLPLEKYGDQ